MEVTDAVERIRADARAADELHERSRAMLVNAVRAGSRAGLSQREIAAAVGRSQPEVSRLLRFHGASPRGRELARNRRRVIELAAAHGVRNIRVFGSLASGTDSEESDIDLLVDVAPGTGLFSLARLESELAELLGAGLFSLARLESELAELLGAEVDVVPARGLRENLAERVLNEAVPL